MFVLFSSERRRTNKRRDCISIRIDSWLQIPILDRDTSFMKDPDTLRKVFLSINNLKMIWRKEGNRAKGDDGFKVGEIVQNGLVEKEGRNWKKKVSSIFQSTVLKYRRNQVLFRIHRPEAQFFGEMGSILKNWILLSKCRWRIVDDCSCFDNQMLLEKQVPIRIQTRLTPIWTKNRSLG